jgi:spermidine/putrescine transport system permease protein
LRRFADFYGPLALSIPGAIGGALVGTFLIGQAFIRVTLPLALPGIFAGSLLTFIPAVGDFINAEVIGAGNPDSIMIGNVIQRKFIDSLDYAAASALAFVLVVGVMALVILYTRLVGSEQVTG